MELNFSECFPFFINGKIQKNSLGLREIDFNVNMFGFTTFNLLGIYLTGY